MISLSIPFDTWALRRVHYALCYSGTIPSRRWWTLDGEPMWADKIEAEYEQEMRGGKLVKVYGDWLTSRTFKRTPQNVSNDRQSRNLRTAMTARKIRQPTSSAWPRRYGAHSYEYEQERRGGRLMKGRVR